MGKAEFMMQHVTKASPEKTVAQVDEMWRCWRNGYINPMFSHYEETSSKEMQQNYSRQEE